MTCKTPRIGFIGFGEVAYHFSKGFKGDGIREILAFDKNARTRTRGKIVRQRAGDAGVELVPGLRQLVEKSDVIISAVWGSTALKVAAQAASLVKAGQFYCDINNTAPSVKTRGAEMLNAKGAKYVDLALFVAPERSRQRSFMLASGDGARALKRIMAPYGMSPDVVADGAGRATTIKTLANIYYKGIQALCLELVLSAWKVGIDPQLLAPLVVKPVEPLPKEEEMAFWAIRGIVHAERKAAELESIIKAVREWGVTPVMLQATRRCLKTVSDLGLKSTLEGAGRKGSDRALLKAIGKVQKHGGAKTS
ncbi:MAG: NAD(P)-binding domain-containing protein [Desulfobacterota bacterium]|nr:NAD(P)-binding domain-containing protein [Thermodesulfobacteriota bacterium]